MRQIMTVTANPTIDKSVEVEQIEKDAKLRCEAVRYDPGGGGINVSRAVFRLGGRSIAIYAEGGIEGAKLDELLEAESVSHRGVGVSGAIRENFTVFDRATESRYRFGMPGPTLSEREWQAVLSTTEQLLEQGGFLVGSGSLPPGVPNDFYARLGRIAASADASFILDTSGDALHQGLVSGVFLVKPNMNELRRIAGSVDLEEPDIREAARALISEGRAEHVVVSLGAGGAILVNSGESTQIRSPTVPIRSRIGAGDSMIAGIALALSRGEEVREAVKRGIAAGAAAVMTPGTELCRREDAERLYEQLRE